ncbi:MAG: tRNA preQ1(34) S-adenosylmethionine ribosyltransferase-isomerase QueA [Candidatus Buchananbacteria bacterium]|nr:tRNA preQ1(34) S-adenosylmethionine ribosyltransferase-isomerase QueA [Candidatus Buchananbacteria bacterium]
MKKQYNLKTYNFNLPKKLIAQQPLQPADTCRLLVLDKKTPQITDDNFLNLTDYLQKGDVLVFNNSKVIPARLIGQKQTGGKVEILLLKQINTNTWECLVGNLPIKKQVDAQLNFTKTLQSKIIKRDKDTAQIKFNLSGQKLMREIFTIGQMPTPPYIKRLAQQNEYQTFFANDKKLGSVAAPTAGLHFTSRMFKKLQQKSVQIEFITLHVGLGTFAPIKETNITKHQIHEEYFELDKATAQRLNQAKKENRRIIAVGTTSVRVLETCSSENNSPKLKPQSKLTKIYIYPGYEFKFVDSIITNFHLPQSSLILLVSAFAGTEFIKKAYQHAIKEKYRFYSFGDVMLIK